MNTSSAPSPNTARQLLPFSLKCVAIRETSADALLRDCRSMHLVRLRETAGLQPENGHVPARDNQLRFPLAPSTPSVARSLHGGRDASAQQTRDYHIAGPPPTEWKESQGAFHRRTRLAGSALGPISPRRGHNWKKHFSNCQTIATRDACCTFELFPSSGPIC